MACKQCSERGLRSSTKWAAEQLVGLSRVAASAEAAGGDDHEMSSAVGEPEVDSDGDEEADTIYLAKAYFDSNEFLRAAHVLRGARAARGRFLRWYSLFLAGEKRKDERMLEESSNGSAAVPTGRPRAVNEQLVLLQAELQPEAEAGRLDGFCQYVYGLTLRELQRSQEACAAFRLAASLCPCFWAAWTELAASLPDLEALAGLELPNHWMASFFRAHAALEAQQNVQARADGHGRPYSVSLLGVPWRPALPLVTPALPLVTPALPLVTPALSPPSPPRHQGLSRTMAPRAAHTRRAAHPALPRGLNNRTPLSLRLYART